MLCSHPLCYGRQIEFHNAMMLLSNLVLRGNKAAGPGPTPSPPGAVGSRVRRLFLALCDILSYRDIHPDTFALCVTW